MERFKQIIRRACMRPIWQTILIALPSFALLLWTLLCPTPLVLNFFAYHLATYALVISITAGMRVRAAWREKQLGEKLRSTAWGERALENPDFRGWIPVYLSIPWNLMYAAVKLIAGRILGSMWLTTLGVYSTILAFMRALIVLPLPARWTPDARADGWRRYLLCGGVLLVMNVVLMVMVILTVREDGSFQYPGPLIYAMAIYAFWAVISATIRLVRAHRRDDPRRAAALAVSLTAALVSLLALQTAMIARFGDGSVFFRRVMTIIVGSTVCFLELCIARYMIIRGAHMLRYNPNTHTDSTP